MEDRNYGKIRSDEPSKLRSDFNKGITAFLVVAACILFYFLLTKIGPIWGVVKKFFNILSPIWYGIIFAYLFNPLMRKIEKLYYKLIKEKPGQDEKKRFKQARIAGATVTMLCFILIVVVLLNLIIPQLYKSVVGLIAILPDQIKNLQEWAVNQNPESTMGTLIIGASEKAVVFVEDWIQNDLLSNLEVVASGVVSTLKGIINAVIGVIITAYFLLDKEKFLGGIKRIIFGVFKKERANFILHLGRQSDRIFGGFIIGKIVDSAIIGVLCFICMSIFKFTENYTLLISVIVGVTNVIPFFGPIIGAIPSAFLILLESPIHAIYFLIFILILQQLDGNVIGPAILGESTGLSAFWIIVAILLGGGFFGFLGMLFGVPVLGMIFYILDMFLSEKLRKKELPNEDSIYIKARYVGEDGNLVETVPEDILHDERIRKENSFIHKVKKLFEKKKEKESGDATSEEETEKEINKSK